MKIRMIGLSLFFTSQAFAAYHEGTVTKIELGPSYGDAVHIGMSFDNPTPCANNGAGFSYSFDAESEVGKKMYAAFLAAQRSNSKVVVNGTGYCTVNTDTEDVGWIQTK